MEEEVLEEERVLQQSLEGLGQRDRKPCLALLHSDLLEFLQGLADLLPLVRILLLRLLRWLLLLVLV